MKKKPRDKIALVPGIGLRFRQTSAIPAVRGHLSSRVPFIRASPGFASIVKVSCFQNVCVSITDVHNCDAQT